MVYNPSFFRIFRKEKKKKLVLLLVLRCDLGHNNSPRRVESVDSDVMNVYVDRWKRFDLRRRLGGISKVFILKKKKEARGEKEKIS